MGTKDGTALLCAQGSDRLSCMVLSIAWRLQSPAQPLLLCGWRQSLAAGSAANKGKQREGRRAQGRAEAAPIRASWKRSKRSIMSELKTSWKRAVSCGFCVDAHTCLQVVSLCSLHKSKMEGNTISRER